MTEQEERIIDKLNNTFKGELPAKIMQVDDKSIIINNLDKLTFKMSWFTVKVLLEIEGINKAQLLDLWLRDFEEIFFICGKREILVSYPDVDNSTILREEIDNNSDQIIKLVKIFLDSQEIPEEKKVILRSLLLRNFDNIINNSFYTMETVNSFVDFGLSQDIFDNKEKILHNIDGKTVTEFYNFCNNHDETIEITLDELIELIFKDDDFLSPVRSQKLPEKYKKDSEISIYTIKKIISELIERQGLTVENLEYIASGAYTDTFRIGGYVVKIGAPKNNRKIPYSKHIIRPVLSYALARGLNIEVQNFVDTKWYEGLSEEQIDEALYQLYARLRDEDVIWQDIKKENVGRLLRKNTSNLEIEYLTRDGGIEREEMDIPDNMMDIVGRQATDTEILPAGELVVIDLDYLIGKGAWCNGNPSRSRYGERFAKRYQQECDQKGKRNRGSITK